MRRPKGLRVVIEEHDGLEGDVIKRVQLLPVHGDPEKENPQLLSVIKDHKAFLEERLNRYNVEEDSDDGDFGQMTKVTVLSRYCRWYSDRKENVYYVSAASAKENV